MEKPSQTPPSPDRAPIPEPPRAPAQSPTCERPPAPEQALKLDRSRVEALDAILGLPFKVLDDGFVRLIDYLGDDAAIVQAARVSYGAGTKQVRDDRGLIRYLMRHRHTTPFEMCELKLHVRVPMDAWRQWIRTRMASTNEYSTRYSIAIDATQRTAPEAWRKQAEENRQGSGEPLDAETGARLSRREAAVQDAARAAYRERLELGVAREQARKDLPLSTYTEAYWKIDLHNLLHFLELRLDPHAQLEIRSYAEIIGRELVARWVPLAWEAFRDYRLGALSLSRIETEIAAAIGSGDPAQATRIAEGAGWLPRAADGSLKRHREREECERKLAALAIRPPWLP